MNSKYVIRLATSEDAEQIGSTKGKIIRDCLDWQWSPQFVLGKINSSNTNVAVVTEDEKIIGFAMMKYSLKRAHLLLLAIPCHSKQEFIGEQLVAWLEKIALVGGINFVYTESHIKDIEARQFYQNLGYKGVQRISRFYRGKETAIRFAKELYPNTDVQTDSLTSTMIGR